MILKEYKKYFVLLFLLILSFIYFFTFQYNTFIYDDAFITYRYANNFSNGNGLVYNVDEPVWGTTSVLYAILLGCMKFILKGSSIHIISQVISLLFFNMIFYYIYNKYKINIIILTLIYLFLFFNECFNRSIFSGMETMMIVYLLILSAFNYKNKFIPFVIPFLILGRVDVAMIFIISVISIKIFNVIGKKIEKKVFLKDILLISIGVILPFIFTFLLYKNIIPNTILAKSVIYRETVFESTFLSRLNMLRTFGYTSYISIPVLIFIFARMIYLKNKKIKIDERIIFPLVFSVFYFAFQVIFVTVTNEWYIPVLTINVVIIMTFLFDGFGKKRYAALILILMISFNIWKNQKYDSLIFRDDNNLLCKTELFKVANIIPQNSKIFCGDIGVIGYCNNSYIYDFAGLVTPKAIEYNKIKYHYQNKGITTDFREIINQIVNENPDYINLREYPFYENIVAENYFVENYELVYMGKKELLYKKKISQ